MDPWIYTTLFVIIVLVNTTLANPQPRPQLGLFNQFLGNKELEERQGKALQPSSLHPTRPSSLLQMFPNSKPTIDPGTREQLEQQKGKLEDILVKLQEINKKREDAEKEKQNGSTTTSYTEVVSTNKPISATTLKPVEVTTVRPVQGKRTWKKITKKRFLLQAKPVIPENEIPYDKDEIAYYLD